MEMENPLFVLHSGWITEKHVDLEYQSYLLHAYLQMVADSFSKSKLYPFLPDLIVHHKNLLHLKNEKLNLAGKFPKKLSKIDLNGKKLKFKYQLRDDEMMEEINSILEYSLPKFEHYIDEGNSLFQLVKENIIISPVGIIPVYINEGYLFLSRITHGRKKASVFQYRFSLFASEFTIPSPDVIPIPEEGYDPFFCNIQTRYVTTTTISTSNTFENIKIGLIRDNPMLPNPATFAVESGLFFPVKETLLPVAKKILVSYVINLLPPEKHEGDPSKE